MKATKIQLLCILIGVGVMSSTGCTRTIANAMAKNEIASVTVERRVSTGALAGGELHGSSLNASLTGLLVDALYAEKLDRMSRLMREENIDVAGMVYTNFVAELKAKGYPVVDESGAATFVLNVHQHGFDEASLTSLDKFPFAVIRAELIQPDGNVIWKGQSRGYASVRAKKQFHPKGEGSDWDAYEKAPEILRDDWQTAIRAALKDLSWGSRK